MKLQAGRLMTCDMRQPARPALLNARFLTMAIQPAGGCDGANMVLISICCARARLAACMLSADPRRSCTDELCTGQPVMAPQPTEQA
jgi:hypothetical protein